MKNLLGKFDSISSFTSSASIHRDAMENAYVHAYDRTANISYMLKEYLKDA